MANFGIDVAAINTGMSLQIGEMFKPQSQKDLEANGNGLVIDHIRSMRLGFIANYNKMIKELEAEPNGATVNADAIDAHRKEIKRISESIK